MPGSNNYGYIGNIPVQGGTGGNEGVMDVAEINDLTDRGQFSFKTFTCDYLVIAGGGGGGTGIIPGSGGGAG